MAVITKEVLKERIRHALMALLLSVGLTMPLAGALDESLISPRILIVIAGTVFLFETVSLHRAAAWTAAFAAAAGALIWIFRGGGAQTISDAGIAISLRLQGVRTAVPLVASPLSVGIAAGMSLLCCLSVLRKATCIPALMLCTAVIMTVWMTDSMRFLLWLLPALVAVLTLLLTYRYEDTSVFRVLPWTTALVLVAYLITGNGPADNPLKTKADEIRQAILDRLFFTEARDVFSLYSVGFSPQGADQLGGRPNPSENPVMIVSTPKTAYLRGTVYNSYTGHGWQNTTGGRRYLWQSRMMADTRAALFDETLPPASVQNTLSSPQKVSVRMLSSSASTLFVPQRVRELNPGGETVPYFSNSSEIFITRNLQTGDTWEAEAPLYEPTDPGIGMLTELCAATEDPRWETVCGIYLELPGHLEQRVKNLALEITSDAQSPYEKAVALQNYLIRNCTYTMDVGDHPANIDFVTSFLLDTRKGYCTYYASAMTVLCRMAGLPARYVEGYLAIPDGTGAALVTGMNAHAWTEVYFSGFGWLTFDAVPRQQSSGQQGSDGSQEPLPKAPATDPAGSAPEPTPTPEPNRPEAQEEPSSQPPMPSEKPSVPPKEAAAAAPDSHENPDMENDPENKAPSFPWWLLAILLAAVGVVLRVLLTSPGQREKRAKTESQRFDIWAEEITMLLEADQLGRKTGETPIHYMNRVDHTGLFSESLTPAGECLSRIRYSKSNPVESDTGLMRDTAILIRNEMSKKGQIRYLVRRFTQMPKMNHKTIVRNRRTGLASGRKRLAKEKIHTYNQSNGDR